MFPACSQEGSRKGVAGGRGIYPILQGSRTFVLLPVPYVLAVCFACRCHGIGDKLVVFYDESEYQLGYFWGQEPLPT